MTTSLLHYTLNTNNTFDTRFKPLPDFEAMKILKPRCPKGRSASRIARRAILEGQLTAPIPAPARGSYSVKITVDSQFALFDLYVDDNLCVINALAWGPDKLEENWQLFQSLYLKLAGQFNLLTTWRSPTRPSSLPWLTSFVLPHPLVHPWMADFEQCLAIALLAEAQLE